MGSAGCRHDLEALTERLIDRVDKLGPDLEPETDYCLAGDDRGTFGPYPGQGTGNDFLNDPGCERSFQPISLNDD